MGSEFDWTPDVIARLRGLWDEGHTTAEIGRRMGVSKNAVIGKAHRLALPPRPSPIRTESATNRKSRARAVPRVARPSLPPLRLEPVARTVPVPTPVPAPIPAPIPVQRRATVFRPPTTCNPCCWPIGEPGTSSFRYCDAPAKPGRPYCPEHAAVAYVRPQAPSTRGDRASPGD